MADLSIDYIADWYARLRGRVFEQFKNDPVLDAIVQAKAQQFQALEDSAQSLLTITSIDDSEGMNLDVIGRKVGQPRIGLDDPTYRLYLKAKVIANRVSGTPEQLYSVFAAMFAGSSPRFIFVPGGPATGLFRILSPALDANTAAVALFFLRTAKQAHVRFILETQALPDSLMFYTAQATYLSSARSVGDDTLNVDLGALASFPASGTVIIDQGTALEETIAYTSRPTPSTLFVPALLTQDHDTYAVVSLVGSPGLGFPVATWVESASGTGDTIIIAHDATAFPAGAGTALIDEGTPTEELVTYSAITGGNTLRLVGHATQNHDIGASIVEPGTGGSLERAHQA